MSDEDEDEVLDFPGEDKLLLVLRHQATAIVRLSDRTAEHTLVVRNQKEQLDSVQNFVDRHVRAQELANELEKQRLEQEARIAAEKWATIRTAIWTVYQAIATNKVLVYTATLAASLLMLGFAIWVLTIAGVPWVQIVNFIPGVNIEQPAHFPHENDAPLEFEDPGDL